MNVCRFGYKALLIITAVLCSFAVIAEDEMNAVRLHAHGPTSDVLHYEKAPIPVPSDNQLLIKVHAASVIPGDWKLRNGHFGDLGEYLPFTMGFDVAGIVVETGSGVTKFSPGDEVFAYLTRGGSFAEFVVGEEKVFARKPKNLTFIEAASVPVSGLAAWHALKYQAQLQPGQTILIHAGAGGVGHFAVQIAKTMGATVITTASPRNDEFLRSLGADQVIDYNTVDFVDVVSDVDVVFDLIGGDVQARSMEVIRPGGILVAITEEPDEEALAAHGIRGVFLATPTDGDKLAELAQEIEAGNVKPHISKVFPLSETITALDLNEQGHTRGKIAIEVR